MISFIPLPPGCEKDEGADAGALADGDAETGDVPVHAAQLAPSPQDRQYGRGLRRRGAEARQAEQDHGQDRQYGQHDPGSRPESGPDGRLHLLVAASRHGPQAHHAQGGHAPGCRRNEQQAPDRRGFLQSGKEGEGDHQDQAEGDHREGAGMAVLQDAPSLLRIPPGQDGVAAVHVPVEMDESREQAGHGRQKAGRDEARQRGQAQERGRQRPQGSEKKPDRGQEEQHPALGFPVPALQRAGDRAEHAPAHEKAGDHPFHRSSSPLCTICRPAQTSITRSHSSAVRSTRARALR